MYNPGNNKRLKSKTINNNSNVKTTNPTKANKIVINCKMIIGISKLPIWVTINLIFAFFNPKFSIKNVPNMMAVDKTIIKMNMPKKIFVYGNSIYGNAPIVLFKSAKIDNPINNESNVKLIKL